MPNNTAKVTYLKYYSKPKSLKIKIKLFPSELRDMVGTVGIDKSRDPFVDYVIPWQFNLVPKA